MRSNVFWPLFALSCAALSLAWADVAGELGGLKARIPDAYRSSNQNMPLRDPMPWAEFSSALSGKEPKLSALQALLEAQIANNGSCGFVPRYLLDVRLDPDQGSASFLLSTDIPAPRSKGETILALIHTSGHSYPFRYYAATNRPVNILDIGRLDHATGQPDVRYYDDARQTRPMIAGPARRGRSEFDPAVPEEKPGENLDRLTLLKCTALKPSAPKKDPTNINVSKQGLRMNGLFDYAKGDSAADSYAKGSRFTKTGQAVIKDLKLLLEKQVAPREDFASATFHASCEGEKESDGEGSFNNRDLTVARSRAYFDALGLPYDNKAAKSSENHTPICRQEFNALTDPADRAAMAEYLGARFSIDKDDPKSVQFMAWLSKKKLTSKGKMALVRVHATGQEWRSAQLELDWSALPDEKLRIRQQAITSLLKEDSQVRTALLRYICLIRPDLCR